RRLPGCAYIRGPPAPRLKDGAENAPAPAAEHPCLCAASAGLARDLSAGDRTPARVSFIATIFSKKPVERQAPKTSRCQTRPRGPSTRVEGYRRHGSPLWASRCRERSSFAATKRVA